MLDILAEKRFWIGLGLASLTATIYKLRLDAEILFIMFGSICLVESIYLSSIIFQQYKSGNIKLPNAIVYTSILILYSSIGTFMMSSWYAQDSEYALVIVTTVTISDVLQYYAGRFIGNTRIGFPSPNKTLEGYILGSFLAMFASSILLKVCLETTFLLIIYGILGDLFVSFCKRMLNIKDISNLLGPHGGYLDRVDGIYMAYILC